jgi:hypothetical protein
MGILQKIPAYRKKRRKTSPPASFPSRHIEQRRGTGTSHGGHAPEYNRKSSRLRQCQHCRAAPILSGPTPGRDWRLFDFVKVLPASPFRLRRRIGPRPAVLGPMRRRRWKGRPLLSSPSGGSDLLFGDANQFHSRSFRMRQKHRPTGNGKPHHEQMPYSAPVSASILFHIRISSFSRHWSFSSAKPEHNCRAAATSSGRCPGRRVGSYAVRVSYVGTRESQTAG